MQLPLTFQQQWLWDLTRRHRDWNCAVPYAFRLKGDLRVPLLERSLQEVIQRHSSLRSKISIVGGVPILDTSDAGLMRLDVTAVSGESTADIVAHAAQIFTEFADQVVDAAVGPLLRNRLLKLSEDEHWLLVAVHRLVADCFSAEQLFREFWDLYAEAVRGRAAAPASEPKQYGDYALWQQRQGREWVKRHEVYWREHLAGARPIQWPIEACAAQGEGGLSGTMNTRLSDTVRDALLEFSKRTRSLAAMVMLSVYVAALWRRCHQADLVVPFNVAGRQSEYKSAIGYFSHILYLRLALTGTETFRELLQLVSNEFFRALSHHDFGRTAAQHPELLSGGFFQWVTWHPDTASDLQSPDAPAELTIERLPLRKFGEGLSALPPGVVDVDVTFFDMPEGIYAQGVYRADRLTPTFVNRLMADIRTTTEAVLLNPDIAIATEPQANVA